LTEDFTTYTETDIPANRIQNVTTNSYDIVGVDLDEIVYLSRLYGVDYFTGDFIHDITVEFTAGVQNGRYYPWVLADTADDYDSLPDNTLAIMAQRLMAGQWRLQLYEKGVASDNYTHPNDNPITFYLTVYRKGTELGCRIYSDSARTTLVDILIVALSGSNDFDYLLGCSTDVSLGGRSLTCAVSNLDFDGGIYSEELPASFTVRQGIADLHAEFDVAQGIEDLFAEFVVIRSATLDLPAEFFVQNAGTVELAAEFVVRHSVPSALVLGPQTATADATYWALAWPFQRKVWYSAGRHWVFYEHDDQLRYVSSVDGVTWDGPTDIRSCTTSRLFGTWVDDNGYLHYAYCRSGNGRTLKYRRGFLESDGTIAWSALEQDASPPYATEQFFPAICVDDAGYPWLTWTRGELYQRRDQMVSKSSTNDGTWTTAPNYPVQLRPPRWYITANITPIADGKAFVSHVEGNRTLVRGWLCDDDGPGAEQVQDLPSDATGSEYGITTIVSLGATAWVAIDTDDGAYVAKYQDGNWVGVVQVDAAGTWPPIIFMVGRFIYVAWLQIEGGGTPNTWMRRISMDGGTTWGASGVLLYAPGGVSRGYYANFAPHLESPLGFAWLHPHPGLAIYYGWLDVVSAPELICTFDVGQNTVNLLAEFNVRHADSADLLGEFFVKQGTEDLKGIFNVGQDSVDLKGIFDVGQDSVDLTTRFEVGQGSAELLGRFEAQAIAELLGKFEAQATTGLLGKFDVGQDSAELLVCFLIPRVYDFSGGMGISFDWWGSGGVDQNIDFEMWSLTGGWVGRFPDGPAEWRQVQLSWDGLTSVDLDGTRPDRSQIIGIYWTYHTSGIRRIDGIRAWMKQDLLCKVVIRNASASGLLSKFEAQATAELLGKVEIQQSGSAELLGRAEARQSRSAGLLGKFEAQATAELLGKFEAQISLDLLADLIIRHRSTAEVLGKFKVSKP